MNDKQLISEKKLKQLLAMLDTFGQKHDKDEQLKLLYQLAPEINHSRGSS